jgi:hypothetical protein
MKVDIRPYTEWEDWKSGMYRDVSKDEENAFVMSAVMLLSDLHRLASAMRDVTLQWKCASEINLHEPPNNRAWLGQAACAFACSVPEHLTRTAWGMLTETQRAEANKIANRVIDEWRYRTCRNRQMELPFNA